jgi:hypothetical protein
LGKKKKKVSQKRAGGVVQGVRPEFKPQYRKKKKFLSFRGCENFLRFHNKVPQVGWFKRKEISSRS